MPVLQSDHNSSFPSYHEVFREKAKWKDNQILDRKERIELAKQAATVREKIVQFLRDCLIFFSKGWTRAVEEHQSYFENKSFQIIRTINTNHLEKTLDKVQEDLVNGYLSGLEPGKILFSHFDLREMCSFQECYQLILEAKQDKNHWLQAFTDEDNLGKELGNLHQLPLEIKDKILILNGLQRKAICPAFSSFLKNVLGNEKLKDLSNTHIQKVRIALALSHLGERKGLEGLEAVTQSLVLLNVIEALQGPAIAKDFKTFFLDSSSVVKNLFLRFYQKDTTKLLQAEALIKKLNTSNIPLPVDLYFSSSLEEMIQKLEEELPENARQTRVKRFGESFANFYEKSKESKESIKELEKIEADFRLCGKSKKFKESIQDYFESKVLIKPPFGWGTGLDNAENFKIRLAEMQKDKKICFVLQIAERINHYVSLEVDPNDLQEAFIQTSLDDEKALNDASVEFDSQQDTKARETWSNHGGDDFAEQLKRIAARDFHQSIDKQHYRSNSALMQRQLLLEKMFFHFNLKDFATEHGELFLSHAVDYLFSEIDKKTDLHCLKKNWKNLLQSLKNLQQELSVELSIEGVRTNEFFKRSWQAYVKPFNLQQPNTLIISDPVNGFTLNPTAKIEFRASIELKRTREYLNTLTETHGELFSSCAEAYLSDQEKEIMEGSKPFSEAAFFKKPFKQQLEDLKGYFPLYFQLQVFSPKTIASLSDSSSPENFKLLSNNLAQLEERFELELTRYSKEEDKKLAQESLHLFIKETQLLEASTAEELNEKTKAAFPAIQAIIKFCQKEPSRQKTYSPEVLAEAFFSLSKDEDANIPLHQRLEELAKTTKPATLKKFNLTCFNKHVQKIGEELVLQHPGYRRHQIKDLVEKLLGKFSRKEEIPVKIEFINRLVKLILSPFSLRNDDIVMIIHVLAEKDLKLDVSGINKLKNINFAELEQFVEEKINSRLEEKKKSELWLTQIKNNPFSLLHSFLPRLIGKLAHPKDDLAMQKKAEKEIAEVLIPLEAYFNNSSWVTEGAKIFSPLLTLLSSKQEGLQGAKTLINEQIEAFIRIDIDSFMGKRDELEELLNDLTIGPPLWTAASKFANAIKKIDKAHRSGTTLATEPKEEGKSGIISPIFLAVLPTNLRSLIELMTGESSSFLHKTLPLLIKYSEDAGIKSILGNWINGHADLTTSTIKTILPSIVSAILKKIVNSLFSHTAEKELMEATLTDQAIVKNLIAAIPTLTKKHQIEVYLNYIKELNNILQSKQPPSEQEIYQLRMLTIKLFQHIIKEMRPYGFLLEESFKEMPN